MKNYLILLIFYLSINTAFTQNVIIDGHVYLEQQTNHSNIKIIFNRTLPVVFLDSVYTDSTGYFNKSIPTGIYNISFTKNQYISATFLNRILYSDSALADTTLELIGLSGPLSGILTAGVYKVGLDIDVKDGDSLIIQPGVFLQFKENTGLNIHGYLFAEGALGDSIIYTC